MFWIGLGMLVAALVAVLAGGFWVAVKQFRQGAKEMLIFLCAIVWVGTAAVLMSVGQAHASTLTPLAATVQAVQQAVEDECDGCVQEDEPEIGDTSDVVEPDVAISWMAVATCDNFEFPHIHSQGEGYGWCAPLDEPDEQMFGWEE